MPMESARITPLVITYNEKPNIERVLDQLRWAQRVLVVDSGSDDGTLELVRSYPNVEVIVRPFDGFATQCNFGLAHVRSEWCLSIDSDYVVPSGTAREMMEKIDASDTDGYWTNLRYCIRGVPLRSAILPPRLTLFRTHLGSYEQDGHAHRLHLRGRSATLAGEIFHDDRKPLKRWLNSQATYASQEVVKLTETAWGELSWADRVRKTGVIAPWLVPAVCLFAKGGLRDGWAGLDYAAQRAVAELVLSMQLYEYRQTRGRISGASSVVGPGLDRQS